VGGKSVLVVAAHPDDETLGCGGTMARHAAEGDEVTIVILGEGLTSRDDNRDAAMRAGELDSLRGAGRRAAEAVGARLILFEALPDNRFDSIDLLDIIKCVERVKHEVRPTIVYTHHPGDMNVDHRLTHQAVLTAFRPMPGEIVEAIYAFETLSSTEWQGPDWNKPFVPDHYVDISEYLEHKKRALGCYAGEMRPYPHPRSVQGADIVARARGVEIGVVAAERFRTIRSIRRLG